MVPGAGMHLCLFSAASAVVSFLCCGNLQPLEAKPPHRTPSARPLLETENAKDSMTWAPPRPLM